MLPHGLNHNIYSPLETTEEIESMEKMKLDLFGER